MDIIPVPQENGPPLLILNPEVVFPAVPSPVYDPTQYYNSGVIGLDAPSPITFALTFTEPGVFELDFRQNQT